MEEWYRGGSGAPEDFAGDWKERDCLEYFSNYGQYGKCDYLAYILMYDKNVGYILDSVNDPAPPHTIMENGVAGVSDTTTGNDTVGGRKSKAEERMVQQAENITKMFGTVFTQAVAPLIESLNGRTNESTTTAAASTSNNNNGSNSNITHQQQTNNMMQSMNLLNSIKGQIDSMEETMDESNESSDNFERKKKRLKTLNKMLDRVYSNLDSFVDN